MEVGRVGGREIGKDRGDCAPPRWVGGRQYRIAGTKTFLRGGRWNDVRASRWSAVESYRSHEPIPLLTRGGLLMEVARDPPGTINRERKTFVNAARLSAGNPMRTGFAALPFEGSTPIALTFYISCSKKYLRS